ncbi:MAG: protein kinase [Planctomycetota bacterium]
MTRLPHLRGYQLLEDLGPSRLGHAYKAEQLRLGRPVLVKLLEPALLADPRARERFLGGAAAAARIHHKNVVTLYGVETCPDTGREFAVLEWVEGTSVEQVLRARGHLAELQALTLALGVAEGLCAIAEHGLVHRLITPHTILVDPEGRPKLTDLGLARPRGGPRVTGPLEVLGAASYMAPEQALGLELDARADLFSLGVVLHEMLSGRLPPREGPVVLPAIPQVSSGTAEVVARLCQPRREDRYPDPAAAVTALRARTPGATAVAPAPADPPPFLLESRPNWRPARLRLRSRVGDAEPVEHLLSGESVVVGRAPDCQLRLDTPIVSRHHAELSWQGDVLWIVPLSTTNPTAVNGRNLDSPLPLGPGDVVTLSREVRLEIDAWPMPQAPPARAEAAEEDGEDSIVDLLGLREAPAAGETTDLAPPAAATPGPRLECAEDGATYPVTPFLQAGSSASCALRLEGAPRKALVVLTRPEGTWLLNVGPDPAAVRVNAEPIGDQSRLRPGDVISLYGRSFVFRAQL